jgi:hypothetical protein
MGPWSNRRRKGCRYTLGHDVFRTTRLFRKPWLGGKRLPVTRSAPLPRGRCMLMARFMITAFASAFGAYSERASARNVGLSLDGTGALDRILLWAIFIITVLAIFLSIEIGFRSAHAVGRRAESGQKWPLEGIGAATLGLLAFTFGLAASRLDTRKSLVLDEANRLERVMN